MSSVPPATAEALKCLDEFNSIYVVTCENGHWGVKVRSSFAP